MNDWIDGAVGGKLTFKKSDIVDEEICYFKIFIEFIYLFYKSLIWWMIE